MNSTSIIERLAGGTRQRFYAEATAVEECTPSNHWCMWDSECCPGDICEWGECLIALDP